jgi:hypothetical protein
MGFRQHIATSLQIGVEPVQQISGQLCLHFAARRIAPQVSSLARIGDQIQPPDETGTLIFTAAGVRKPVIAGVGEDYPGEALALATGERPTQVGDSRVGDDSQEGVGAPAAASHPNPFNASTLIRLSVDAQSARVGEQRASGKMSLVR